RNTVFTPNINVPGAIAITSVNTGSGGGLAGNGHVFELMLPLAATLGQEDSVPVQLNSARFFDILGAEIVANTGALAEITPDCLRGDVNHDGSSDAGDTLTCLRMAVCLETVDEC